MFVFAIILLIFTVINIVSNLIVAIAKRDSGDSTIRLFFAIPWLIFLILYLAGI